VESSKSNKNDGESMNFSNALTITLPRLLIADDQPDVLTALRLLLKGEGIESESANSPEAVVKAVSERDFDLVLIDLNYTRDTTSGEEGLDLIARIRALDGALPVVGMTAWGSVELAVEAMKRGINDFVLKPWENSRLLEVLRSQIEAGRARRQQARTQAVQAQELAAARTVQQNLLPKFLPPIRGCEASAQWQPAREVGGDYFNVAELSNSLTSICIGDVMGKGMPAALLMSNLQAFVKAFAGKDTSPDKLCTEINHAMCDGGNAGKLITFFYSQYDSASRRLLYTNAGHNPPLLIRSDGSLERLNRGGTLLGAFSDSEYDLGEIKLNSGDRLLLYTDGVTEAVNHAGEEFGESRLEPLMIENRDLSAEALRVAVMAAVTEFSGGNFQDDAAIIVLAVI